MYGCSSENDDPGEEMLEPVSGISSNEMHPFRVEFPSVQSRMSLSLSAHSIYEYHSPRGILVSTPSIFPCRGAGRVDGKKFPKRTNNSELDIQWDASVFQTGNSIEQFLSALELCMEYTCLAALAFIFL